MKRAVCSQLSLAERRAGVQLCTVARLGPLVLSIGIIAEHPALLNFFCPVKQSFNSGLFRGMILVLDLPPCFMVQRMLQLVSGFPYSTCTKLLEAN